MTRKYMPSIALPLTLVLIVLAVFLVIDSRDGTPLAQAQQPSDLELVASYDSNGNGIIDISELFDAIDDYFADEIGISDLFDVIEFYFSGEQVGSGPSGTPTPTPEPNPDTNAQADYDTDGDGLIEISNLEQLNAIRYDPDGDGVPLDGFDLTGDGRDDFSGDNAARRYATAFPIITGGAVCGGGGCTGYELARSLDFDDPDSYASGEVNAAWTQGAGWAPILQCHGYASACTREVSLTFDGNGHTISNLYSSGGGFSGYVGLFFRVDGTVRRLGLLDVDLIGRGAPLTATNHGSITDTYVTGTVVAVRRGITGTADASGFAMNNYGTIRDSHSEVELSLREGDSPSSGGGLAGFVWWNDRGVIEDSYATGNVSGRVVQTAGFVFINNSGTIRDCYATGDATSRSIGNGGLVNRNGGLIENSYATGFVSYGGGLVRENFDRIINSYATGDVGSGGGLAYENDGGSIINSYATGDVGYSGRPLTYASAGLVVLNRSDSNTADGRFLFRGIFSSYATGNVNGLGVAGGLVANNYGSIFTSYATGDVNAEKHLNGSSVAGGLVGKYLDFRSGMIVASYATGNVSAEQEAGGLVGNHSVPPRTGGIIASYATGRVTSEGYAGGLVGVARTSGIYDSYFDANTSGLTAGLGYSAFGLEIEANTTDELQSPTDYTGIYADWNLDLDNIDLDGDHSTGVDDFWDFGASSQYPALKADWDGDGVATAREFGGQGR